MKKILLVLILILCGQSYAVPPLFNKKVPLGKTWSGRRQSSLSFAITREHIRAQMVKLGFKEKHEITLDRKGFELLLLFEKGTQQKLFLIRRLDVGSTEIMWGDINAKK